MRRSKWLERASGEHQPRAMSRCSLRRMSSEKHQPRDSVMLCLGFRCGGRPFSTFDSRHRHHRIGNPAASADLRFRNPAAFLLPLVASYTRGPLASLRFMMVRLAAGVWVLLLAATAGRAYAYVRHATLPSFNRRRMVTTGARSLKCDATSPLIEATACRVLRMVLRNGREAHVSCSVRSEAFDLLQGRLRGATVKGQGWASRLGLTARTIDVDVGNVNLDVGALFRRGVLQFRTPSPSGKAVVVFNAADFGNFLSHRVVSRTVLAGRTFVFAREGVAIDAGERVVAFGGKWGGRNLRVALSQASARERLVARVTLRADGTNGSLLAAEEADVLALAMADYFNSLEVDLDGPMLRFSSLSFEGAGGKGGRLRLNLGIVVRKLPSIRSVASF